MGLAIRTYGPNMQSFTCECCFGKMHMSKKEYKDRSAGGALVYCDYCRPFVKPAKITSRGERGVAAKA